VQFIHPTPSGRVHVEKGPIAGQPSSFLQQVLHAAKSGSRGDQDERDAKVAAALRKYRGVLRVQDREDRQASKLHEKVLRQRQDTVTAHALWLASMDGKPQRRRWRAPSTYWGTVAKEAGLALKANTSFRQGPGTLLKFGIRNSVMGPRRDALDVRRVGSLVAVRHRSFDEKLDRPAQAAYDVTMGKAAKAEKLRYHLRPRILLAVLKALESPLNPPSVAVINIQRMHELLQANAFHNPQPWFLAREQVVRIVLGGFCGLKERLLHQLISCFDTSMTDRIRFAEITANLFAATHPSMVVMGSLQEDFGPYKLGLTILRAVFKFYATVTRGRLQLLTLLQIFRSLTARVEDITSIDNAFRAFMAHVGKELEYEVSEEELVGYLKAQVKMLEEFQMHLNDFQLLVQGAADEELISKGESLSNK
jgi:hypothetical protein